jgi:adenosylmethionine-8-amino-7-oxononanoate aminotransferase
VGAVLVRDRVDDALAAGSRRFTLGHTWDGAPLACAVGLAVLDAMRSEGLVERVRERGAALRDELADALAGIPLVREVRGHGYLLGVSFVDPRDGGSFLPPDLRVGGRIDAAAFDRELITLSTQPTRDGYAGDQTLFAPPFTTTDEELEEMVSRFVDSVRHVADEVEPMLQRAPEPVGGPR